MRAAPVRERLGPGGLGVGVAARAHDRHEHLRLAHLAGLGVGDGNGGAAVIDEETLTGLVDLAHGDAQGLGVATVTFAELAVLVAGGVISLVLLPEQSKGHALPLEFLVDLGPVGLRDGTRAGGLEGGEELSLEFILFQGVVERPAELGGLEAE
ncbi:hypothetical protein D3C87_1664960 [compost metagenome]